MTVILIWPAGAAKSSVPAAVMDAASAPPPLACGVVSKVMLPANSPARSTRSPVVAVRRVSASALTLPAPVLVPGMDWWPAAMPMAPAVMVPLRKTSPSARSVTCDSVAPVAAWMAPPTNIVPSVPSVMVAPAPPVPLSSAESSRRSVTPAFSVSVWPASSVDSCSAWLPCTLPRSASSLPAVTSSAPLAAILPLRRTLAPASMSTDAPVSDASAAPYWRAPTVCSSVTVCSCVCVV